MDPRTIHNIMRGLDAVAGTPPKGQEPLPWPVTDYTMRCDKWRKKIEQACASVKRCEAAGSTYYAVETLGYIVWLIHRRPMRGREDDIFGEGL